VGGACLKKFARPMSICWFLMEYNGIKLIEIRRLEL